MDENNKKIDLKAIHGLVQNFLQKISPEAIINSVTENQGTITIAVHVSDPSIFIEQNQEILFSIQHLLKIILHKNTGMLCPVDLDINGYKKKRHTYLKELAINSANEVALAKHEVVLPPMNSYERRLIHLELSERRDIAVQSSGEGNNRHIVISPIPNNIQK